MRLLIDLSKAFDAISHPLLLDTLQPIGIRGKSLKVFENYLTDRSKLVKLNDVSSEKGKIEYGISQGGTILSPTLFNIYINNLFAIKSSGTIIGFADDTAIFSEEDSWDDLNITIEKGFKMISMFLK